MSGYVYEELIVEIFTRLPSKSLIRFRSLSKSLYSCISSPGFIRLHTFRSTQKILSIHYYLKKEAVYTLHGEDRLSLSPRDGYIGITTITCPLSSFYRFLGSCNGIFCLESRNSFTLWNPSIRRKLTLPCFPRDHKILEPFTSEEFGFGFDPISDDYKIIHISYARDTSLVYAVKTGIWREIASPKPKYKHTYVSYQACLLNGVLHWPLSYTTESEEMYLSYSILTFNLSTHVFGMLPLPTPTWQWITPRSHIIETRLTTIQGSLALISFTMCQIHDTWIRVRRDSSWSVAFKLSTIELYIRGALRLQPQPYNDDDLLLTTVGGDGEVLYVYNPKTRRLLPNVRSKASKSVFFYRFVETLHLLDMGEVVCETTQL